MVNRYQGRPFPVHDEHDRSGDPHASAGDESDPLAELARLIGQDPFVGTGRMSRANLPLQPRANQREQYRQPAATEPDDAPRSGPPAWMQHAARQESQEQHYQEQHYQEPHYQEPQYEEQHYPEDYSDALPLQRHTNPRAVHEPDYRQPATSAYANHQPDPSRYDDVLYGQLDPATQEHDQAFTDDSYYEEGDDGEQEHVVQKRRGGIMTVAAVLALAVVGTGGAFAYRTFIGSSRSGEPPIIKADTGPTKIVPTPSDGITKVPDRLTAGDGTERIVSREEAPVDLNAKSGARVVFPPLNPNANPPAAASAVQNAPAGFTGSSGAGNGTLPSNEPRKIKTLSVRVDQPEGAAPPPAPKPPAAGRSPASGAPLSLAPTSQPAPVADAQTRVAAVNPVQIAPSGGGGSGAYLVQVSSQRSEADAQASYRSLQGKFPAVLGSRSPVIKRADLGDKGIYYRAMVGPFASPEEATQLCGSLKSAGGQCVVQRN
jgi:cell division protein FtsN